ncbi:preprotein translocase subunit SecG [Marinimicrobium sp. LS-A18]|uniref:preprotein translocase subunit SecG n=1 Tax=Marinimicrobium sp. LS-A18 TaxID=1381596 RepID=UPI0004636861|nr:preprotein translocase subunit SecG [Marinimicrobium sp. LS-A18]
METLVLVVHILTALAIIALILLQQGKGAVAGASFGSGASQTVFGSQGSGGFFTRMTGICAVVFFATSFGLAIIAKNKAGVGIDSDIPAAVEQSAPAAQDSEVPAVEEESSADEVPEVPAE